ncbi:MAG: hypothetical protein JO251_02395 [Verrucomicrobia bacterium]|nr:hypothetical protein [Verrucomicrobiota bacterium]
MIFPALDPQPHYNVEFYVEDPANGVDSTLSGPIGLNGVYQKGTPSNFGISAVKGTWQIASASRSDFTVW